MTVITVGAARIRRVEAMTDRPANGADVVLELFDRLPELTNQHLMASLDVRDAKIRNLLLQLAAETRERVLQVRCCVLLIALIKTRFVIRNYMEVRFAPAWLQLTCDAWLLCLFGLIACFYWVSL